jgi:hypothetical protein
MKKPKKQLGYVALIAVLIIGAAVLNISLSSVIVSITNNMNGLSYQNLSQATSLSHACGEKALMDLKENESYAGNEIINLGNGTCEVLAIENLGDQSRIIKTIGRVNGATRKTRIEISSINPSMNIVAWQEVNDF